jgi:hypothetical protein
MVDGLGYWVNVKVAVNMTVAGYVIPPASSPPAYKLTVGWNLVGFKPQPTLGPESVGTYLTSVTGSYETNSVWVYDSLTSVWVRADSSYILQPGVGMLIFMTAPTTLRP